MAFISLAVLTALCLLLASTRKYAVLGAGLLLYFHPWTSLALLATAGIVVLYLNWRKPDVLSRLPFRRP